MWQAELVRSAGSEKNSLSSISPTFTLELRYEFAEGVTTKLSLPWSSFEHMAGNWLATVESPPSMGWPTRIEELVEKYLVGRQDREIDRLRLPITNSQLLSEILVNGRQVVSDSGLGEYEGEGVVRVPLTPVQ